MVKTSELLALKGVPVREKSERVTELLQLHHRIKEKIREYEALLNMAVKFHQLNNEVSDHRCYLSPAWCLSTSYKASL